jgi:PTS system nitrogen regulatory IIA component
MLSEKSSAKNNIFSRLLTPSCTRSLVNLDNKKRCLQTIAELLHSEIDELSSQDIIEHLAAREKIGSCSLGKGVALPHARVVGINKPQIALITLENPIAYDDYDKENVDIVCGLLIPEESVEDHLA